MSVQHVGVEIEVIACDGAVAMAVAGDLDESNLEALRARFAELMDGVGTVHLDLRAVGFLGLRPARLIRSAERGGDRGRTCVTIDASSLAAERSLTLVDRLEAASGDGRWEPATAR